MRRHCPMCGDFFEDNGSGESYCPACQKYAKEFEEYHNPEARVRCVLDPTRKCVDCEICGES